MRSQAIFGKVPTPLLDTLGALAVRFFIGAGNPGLRSLAAVAADGFRQAEKPAARHASEAATTDRQAAARHAPAGNGEKYGRFQREIVPHLDAAYNFARFLSRNPDAAQDIVQESFLRAYRGFDGYQGGDARAWVFSIVRNCYHNWLLEGRRKARLEVDVHPRDDAANFSIDDVPCEDDTPETALLRSSEAGKVRRVLDLLPRSLREVLVLRELEGLSYREIAESAGLPIGTVMSRLARARDHFADAWQSQTRIQEGRK